MKTSLVPIIKCKTVDSNDKNNYRPKKKCLSHNSVKAL